MLTIYTVLIYVLAPFALAVNAWRGRRDPAYRDRLGERWGYTRVQFDRAPLWVHAVSVGEVQACAALVRALQRKYPHCKFLLTTGTPTGAQRVRALFGDTVQHAYLPYDMPGAVKRFLKRVQPVAGIVMETEIWPNLFRECRRQSIPLVLASARLSEKSVRRFCRFRPLVQSALKCVAVAAQSGTDAERFRMIGADPAAVCVVGNIKFDIEIAPDLKSAGESVRAAQFPNRQVWIAASTHEGEEELVLQAHGQVCEQVRNALLLLVPRHPQRFQGVRDMLVARSVRFASRSRSELVQSDTRVLLVDTLGELLMFYASADVAFVGGTLVPIGGHNLLEPAVLEKPIVFGPHNFNAPDIAQMFLAAGAACQVDSSESLAHHVVRLFGDDAARDRMGHHAAEIVSRNRGAIERLMVRIDSLVHPSEERVGVLHS
jgi:3-deoxy-D-manno-octulosonic-acid transferase